MFLIGVKQKGVQQLKRESFIHLQEEKKEKKLYESHLFHNRKQWHACPVANIFFLIHILLIHLQETADMPTMPFGI